MNKVMTFIRNYFVEVVGFLVIMALIILISFLKFDRKTFNCKLTHTDDGVKITESYVVKQKNNHIKTIDYKYIASPSDKSANKKALIGYYKDIVENVNKSDFNIDMDLTYKKGKIYLEYTLTSDDIKDLKEYKTTRKFIRNIKSNGFTCK